MIRLNTYVLTAAIVVMTGCSSVPLSHIQMFSDTTKDLSDEIISVVEMSNEVEINRQIYSLANTGASRANSLSLDELKGIEGYNDNIKKNPVYLSAKALGNYAQALSDLATMDTVEATQKASVELYGSLTELEDTYNKFADPAKQIEKAEKIGGLITQSVYVVARAKEEKDRAKAIAKITRKSNDSVQRLTALIEKEVNNMEVLTTLSMSSHKARELNNYKVDWDKHSPKKRYSALLKFRQDAINIETTRDAFKKIAKAAKVIAATHDNVAKSSNTDEDFDVEYLRLQIGKLKVVKNELSDLKDSLQNI